MACPFESGSFRLKQGPKEKSVTRQFDGAYLSLRTHGTHFQPPIHQARHVSGIRTEAAAISLADLIRVLDLMKPASRRQVQGFLHLNQETTQLRDHRLCA